MNVTYPMIPEEVSGFCAGKRAVLIVEEGQPAYIEDAVHAILRRADNTTTKLYGKAGDNQHAGAMQHETRVLPLAGEYTGEVVLAGMARFVGRAEPRGIDAANALQKFEALVAPKKKALELLGGPVPFRPPGFCVGCPERPVFSAMKMVERDLGAYHVSADIGCHTFSTLPPFNIGHTVLGYGLGMASNSARQHDVRPAHRDDHGRWRVLAQRADFRHCEHRVQQGRRHPRHHEERLQFRDRYAGTALQPPA